VVVLFLCQILLQAGAIECNAEDFKNNQAFLRWTDITAALLNDKVVGVTLLFAALVCALYCSPFTFPLAFFPSSI
jgi:hypothetical protein